MQVCLVEAYSDVNVRNVANDIILGVKDREGGHAFVVHELERCCKWFVAAGIESAFVLTKCAEDLLYSQNILRPYAQVLDEIWVQLVHVWEARPVLPEEFDKA